MLAEDTQANSPYIHIVRKCKALISRTDWEVSIGHCYREANRAADCLANLGVQSEQKIIMIEAVPKDLHAILLEDISGVTRPRWVPKLARGLG